MTSPDPARWKRALTALRTRIPRTFRYRGFAPRRPEPSALEQGLVPELLSAAKRLVPSGGWQQLQAQAPGLVEAIALRAVRLVLVEELAIGELLGADGHPVPATQGVVIGRRALRRQADELRENRQSPWWVGTPSPLLPALERVTRALGECAQRLRQEHLRGLRRPLEERRRAAQDAVFINAAIEAGEPWE
jgi:hypothetical protein